MAVKVGEWWDDERVILHEQYIQDGVHFTRQSQPTRDMILEENKRSRQDADRKDLSFGGDEMRIPKLDLYYLLPKKHPDLFGKEVVKDKDHANRIKKWAASKEAQIYRTR